MKIERKTDGPVTILAFTGELDTDTLPTVSENIDALIESGATKLVLNMGALEFITSSAVGYLIKTRKHLLETNGEFVISAPSTFFRSTFRALGVDQIVKIFDNDDAALAYFAA